MSNARRIQDAAPSSPKSDRVKWVRALDRRALRLERSLFRVEGPQAVREALRYPEGGEIEELFLTDEAAEKFPELEREFGGIRVPAAVIAGMSEATSPQGVVAIAHLPKRRLAEIESPQLAAIAVDVRDPGNLGTMIRTADAAGADLFICANSCVDAYSPKVVRSTAGSLWHLPVVVDISIDEAVMWVRGQYLQVLAADGSSTTKLNDVDLSRPTAWLLGNEAWGLAPETSALADQSVSLPIYGKAESLNVATATAVLLFASAQSQHPTH
jgi:RNA methyltransferase, TrmH family